MSRLNYPHRCSKSTNMSSGGARRPQSHAAIFSCGDPMPADHMRFHRAHSHLHNTFGSDQFGKQAEAFARFFGTPGFLIAQTIVVAIWVGANIVGAASRWDPYPFILLNLVFSLQAAYA